MYTLVSVYTLIGKIGAFYRQELYLSSKKETEEGEWREVSSTPAFPALTSISKMSLGRNYLGPW